MIINILHTLLLVTSKSISKELRRAYKIQSKVLILYNPIKAIILLNKKCIVKNVSSSILFKTHTTLI